MRTVLEEPGTCESCEQHVARHQRPGVAALYRYPVTEVALALVRVGRGMSYTEAARRCRIRQAPEAQIGQGTTMPSATSMSTSSMKATLGLEKLVGSVMFEL